MKYERKKLTNVLKIIIGFTVLSILSSFINIFRQGGVMYERIDKKNFGYLENDIK